MATNLTDLIGSQFSGGQGVQGVQGLQGLANQGIQGVQGLQGTQGLQGRQGTQGLSNQGVQGSVGSQGNQGLQGQQGVQGTTGNDTGVPYTFSTITTDADPGSGTFRFDNSTVSSVTNVYIDNLDQLGNTQTGWYDGWDDSTSTIKGQLILRSISPTIATEVIFNVTGAVTVATGYYKIPVSFVSAGGSRTNGMIFSAIFVRTGDQGLQGTQGTQGIQGQQGTQGTQGLQGLQGLSNQGVQGLAGSVQGLQGAQGVQGIIGPTSSVPDQSVILSNISSSFNGSTTQFTISDSSGNFINSEIDTAARLLISVGGIVQQPDPSQTAGFYISGGTDRTTDPIKINFVEAPKSGLSFFGVAIKSTNSPTTSFVTTEESIAYSIVFGV